METESRESQFERAHQIAEEIFFNKDEIGNWRGYLSVPRNPGDIGKFEDAIEKEGIQVSGLNDKSPEIIEERKKDNLPDDENPNGFDSFHRAYYKIEG